MTPLHVAAECARNRVVKYLVHQNADVNVKASNGVSTCDHANDSKLVLVI